MRERRHADHRHHLRRARGREQHRAGDVDHAGPPIAAAGQPLLVLDSTQTLREREEAQAEEEGEQVEEEATISEIIGRVKLVDGDGAGLLRLDAELAGRPTRSTEA